MTAQSVAQTKVRHQAPNGRDTRPAVAKRREMASQPAKRGMISRGRVVSRRPAAAHYRSGLRTQEHAGPQEIGSSGSVSGTDWTKPALVANALGGTRRDRDVAG